MPKNRWYGKPEDEFLMRRVRALRPCQRPYGRRSAVYRRIARELARRFGVRRPWRGVQVRICRLLAVPAGQKNIENF